MKRLLTIGICVVIVAGLTSSALASPGLTITEPPVTTPDAGPPFDPLPEEGQWFRDRVEEMFESLAWEFHDNVLGFGGGFSGTLAIEGYATGIVYSGANIVAFDIGATITNDLLSATGTALPGANSHGESLSSLVYCPPWFPMLDTKLTIEFAVDRDAFAAWGGGTDPPYVDVVPHIVAENHDQLAWFSYPEDGDFLVPTWDFGDIPSGASVSVLLEFTVDGIGLDPADPRFGVIVTSEASGIDMLANRSTSLKVSDWLSDMALDIGAAYPPFPGRGSNASVFFVPEPATLCILGCGAIGILRRRRPKVRRGGSKIRRGGRA